MCARWRTALVSRYAVVYIFTVFALVLLVQIVLRLIFMTIRSALLKRRKTPDADAEKKVEDDRAAGADRAAGTLLGSAKMAALLWLVLSMCVIAEKPLQQRGIEIGMRDSGFLELSRQYNAVAILFGSQIHSLDQTLRRMETARTRPKNAAFVSRQPDRRRPLAVHHAGRFPRSRSPLRRRAGAQSLSGAVPSDRSEGDGAGDRSCRRRDANRFNLGHPEVKCAVPSAIALDGCLSTWHESRCRPASAEATAVFICVNGGSEPCQPAHDCLLRVPAPSR